MTHATLPLATRPRRAPVRRAHSQRAARRSLRRTAPRTTARTWRRSALPGAAVATARARPGEVAAAMLVVLLLAVPVLVWTHLAAGAFVALAVALAAVTYLASARRVVVGDDYVAVRRLGRYSVAHADHVRHLELRAMQGGVLCLHTDDGRFVRLRRVELEQPGIADGLKSLAGCSDSTRDSRVCALLDLVTDDGRVVDRYVPT
jgi:hypothetical protein